MDYSELILLTYFLFYIFDKFSGAKNSKKGYIKKDVALVN
ncbi:hypothetical protein AWRIB429_1554 [Oenococcus oeni AWRIB429]|uniref:Uncharacterized protein n=1 Tax=Oenococcus oeni AWRIB429 TaxID=655225 RepID=D3LB24_OENOE|nr:hypothetical protein AWRIB429_1554 [Oenococcus oeni AWRIB429]KEP86495.1 hypothetical protein X278_03585 [Oenococcus oeni IOEB_0205]KZD14648.1 hypothetical protein AC229_1485 [Oenococcus oeni]